MEEAQSHVAAIPLLKQVLNLARDREDTQQHIVHASGKAVSTSRSMGIQIVEIVEASERLAVVEQVIEKMRDTEAMCSKWAQLGFIFEIF